MHCVNILWHFPQLNVALTASVDPDDIFGTEENLSLLARASHSTLIIEKVTIGMAIEKRVALMEEWHLNTQNGEETFFINVNARERRRIVDTTVVAIHAGHIGLALWDDILDCSFSRWKLQDVRDEVYLLKLSLN